MNKMNLAKMIFFIFSQISHNYAEISKALNAELTRKTENL